RPAGRNGRGPGHRTGHRGRTRRVDQRGGDARRRREHRASAPPGAGGDAGVKVLAVGDEPQILRALRASLAARGHDVLTVPNGETALETVATEPVELVVLDLGLPGMDGVEVIRRLRSWSDVPVIVLSVRDAQD